MALSSETNSVEYTGNGSTVAFQTTFKFLDNTHLVVKVTPSGGGTPVTKTLNVDYAVTGAGQDAGGTVTFVTAPANGETVRIERTLPMTQTTSFRTQGSFSPALHEDGLDYRTMVEQQLDRRVKVLESGSSPNNALAGNGLSVDAGTWHVGAGNGIIADADAVRVNFSATAGDQVDASVPGAPAENTAARSDHGHQVMTGTPGAITIGAAAAAGSAATLARSDHAHSLAAPAAPVNVTKAAASTGSATAPARADHKHDITTGVPTNIADSSNSEGTASSLARSDHAHAHGDRGGGSLHAAATTSAAGFLSATDKTKLDVLGDAFGGTLQTTTATPADAALYSGTNGTLFVLEVAVAALKTSSTQGAGYKLLGTFRMLSGTITQIGATTIIATHEDVAGWDAVLVVDATKVVVRVTGAVDTTINWHVYGRVFIAP